MSVVAVPWRLLCRFCGKSPEEFVVNKFSDLRSRTDLYDTAIQCFSDSLDKRMLLPTCLSCEKFLGDLHTFSEMVAKTHLQISRIRKREKRGVSLKEEEEDGEVEEEYVNTDGVATAVVEENQISETEEGGKGAVYEIIIEGEGSEFIATTEDGEEMKKEIVLDGDEQAELDESESRTVRKIVRRGRKRKGEIVLVASEENITLKERQKSSPGKDKRFVCEECGKAWNTKGQLKEHMIIHSDERPFQCNHCPKRFKNQQRLRIHEDIHNDTAYICPECGLQLNTKRTLTMHMVVHSEVKRFKCEFCGNEYKRQKALKSHLIIHSGLRPYSCPFCDKTFVNGSNCRTHKRRAHPELLAALEAATANKNKDGMRERVLPSLHELQNNLSIRGVERESEQLIPILPFKEEEEGEMA